MLEILVVLAILGLLVGLVAPAVMRQSARPRRRSRISQSSGSRPCSTCTSSNVGNYPTTEQGLQALSRGRRADTLERPLPQGREIAGRSLGAGHLPIGNPSQRPGRDFDL